MASAVLMCGGPGGRVASLCNTGGPLQSWLQATSKTDTVNKQKLFLMASCS